MRTLSFGLPILLFAILTGWFAGCGASVSEPSAGISGVVKEIAGVAVPNATVEIVRLNGESAGVATCNSKGQFSFPEAFAPSEQFIVHVRHPEFKPFSKNLAEAIRASGSVDSLQLLIEPVEGNCVGISVAVVYEEENAYKAKDATGAEIRLYSQGRLRATAISGTDFVAFPSLPPGTFRLEIRKPGFRLGEEDFSLTECGSYPITFWIYRE